MKVEDKYFGILAIVGVLIVLLMLVVIPSIMWAFIRYDVSVVLATKIYLVGCTAGVVCTGILALFCLKFVKKIKRDE